MKLSKCPKGCRYEGKFGASPCCDYLLIEGRRRGCEGGKNCERFEPLHGVKPNRQTLPVFKDKKKEAAPWWDDARKLLLSEMKSDIEIAEKCGVTYYAVRAWRDRNHLPAARELKAERIDELARKIKAFRASKGWTQEQFALRIGTNCKRVAKWERCICFAPESVRKLVGCEW